MHNRWRTGCGTNSRTLRTVFVWIHPSEMQILLKNPFRHLIDGVLNNLKKLKCQNLDNFVTTLLYAKTDAFSSNLKELGQNSRSVVELASYPVRSKWQISEGKKGWLRMGDIQEYLATEIASLSDYTAVCKGVSPWRAGARLGSAHARIYQERIVIGQSRL